MGFISIIRPVNCLITFASIWVGARIGQGIGFSVHLLLAGVAGIMVCAFGNIVNDIYDIEIDRQNNPERPIPAGKITKGNAIVLAIVCGCGALALSIILGLMPFFLVFLTMLILFLYSAHFKKTIFANPIVSFTTGLSFVLGGIIAGNIWCLFPFVFSFFIHFPREIIKDILDLPGDREHQVQSLPIRFGKKISYMLSALSLGILCIILPIPYILKVLEAQYMVVILIGAYPLLIFCLYKFATKPVEDKLKIYSNLLKISMVIGLVAMVI